MVSSRLPSLAMMRGGVADVDPFLVSRNTLGNGKTTNSKSQTSNVKMVVAESGGGLHLAMWGGMMGYTCVGVEVVVPK